MHQYSIEEKKDITKESIIQRKEYNEICSNLLNINVKNLLNNGSSVVDGSAVRLKFMSDNWQQVEYYTYGFDFDEKTTPSKEFLYVIKSILRHAEIEIYGINKFKTDDVK